MRTIKTVTILMTLMTLAISVSSVSAETYAQCKKRILDDIAKVEQQTGRLVTKENKDLSEGI